MGGKGSGNRTRSNPNVAKRADMVDPDVNAAVIDYMQALWKLPEVDLSKEEEVEERIDLFFDMCREYGRRPLVGNLALNFGMSPDYFKHVVLYEDSPAKNRGLTQKSKLLLKKAYCFINSTFEQVMLNAKNPVPFIYYTKAQLDWREAPNETVITHKTETPRLSGGSQKEIEARYAEIVGIDGDSGPSYELPTSTSDSA